MAEFVDLIKSLPDGPIKWSRGWEDIYSSQPGSSLTTTSSTSKIIKMKRGSTQQGLTVYITAVIIRLHVLFYKKKTVERSLKTVTRVTNQVSHDGLSVNLNPIIAWWPWLSASSLHPYKSHDHYHHLPAHWSPPTCDWLDTSLLQYQARQQVVEFPHVRQDVRLWEGKKDILSTYLYVVTTIWYQEIFFVNWIK